MEYHFCEHLQIQTFAQYVSYVIFAAVITFLKNTEHHLN